METKNKLKWKKPRFVPESLKNLTCVPESLVSAGYATETVQVLTPVSLFSLTPKKCYTNAEAEIFGYISLNYYSLLKPEIYFQKDNSNKSKRFLETLRWL